eukprot:scaffold2992_cov214-Amphora_coffeaeformis.AAC.30
MFCGCILSKEPPSHRMVWHSTIETETWNFRRLSSECVRGGGGEGQASKRATGCGSAFKSATISARHEVGEDPHTIKKDAKETRRAIRLSNLSVVIARNTCLSTFTFQFNCPRNKAVTMSSVYEMNPKDFEQLQTLPGNLKCSTCHR